MGAECSCMRESTPIDFKPEVISSSRPRLTFSTMRTTHQICLTSLPLVKSDGDSEADYEFLSPRFDSPSQPQETKSPRLYSKFQTNDLERVSQEDSKDSQLKKNVSFFRFSSIESRQQANPVEFTNQSNGDWRLQNIRLTSLIKKSHGKYLWEANNIATGKKCGVKMTFVETSKLLHTNLTKTETILKELVGIQNPSVIDIYSFYIWESELHHRNYLVIVIVQELTKCSLRDVHSIKADKRSMWPQNQILMILRDIYSGLVACKERQVTHGKLIMENVLVPEAMDRLVLADFNIKMPIVGDTKTASSTPSRTSFSKSHQALSPEDTLKLMSAPDERDIFDLTQMILKLLTFDENVGFTYENLRKDERYKRSYFKVFEALDLIANRRILASQALEKITDLIDKKGDKVEFGLPVNFDIRVKEDSYIEGLFTKIDCYELMKQHDTAMEVYAELLKIIENKDQKGTKEYQEYVKCINRTINHYLSVSDWLKAKELSAEFNSMLKNDEVLKRTLKSYPKEYINFIILLGNISEGLNEPEKAISLYNKGLSYCVYKSITIESYPSALKRISNLLLLKKEYQPALENLKKLASFYETQQGYHIDKADTYMNIADILTQQCNYGQGVKFYIKSLENMKKGKLPNNEAYVGVLNKIIENYKALNEDENILTYMIESLEFKKMFYGKDSPQCMEALKEIAAMHMRMKDHREALKYYLIYHKRMGDDINIFEEQYSDSLRFLAEVHLELQEYQKARDYFEKYAELKGKTLGIESKEYLDAQDKIADILYREDKYEESLTVQLNSLKIKELMLKKDELYLLISLSNIGDTYFASNNCQKALEYHHECLRILEDRKEEKWEEYSKMLLKIAFDFEKSGNNGQALRVAYQSFQISERNGSELDTEKTIEMYEMLSRAKETKLHRLDFTKLTTQME